VSSYGTNAWLATDLARRLNGNRSANGEPDAPPVASARAYLRRGLPAVYREDDFGMRFVGALETVLDPIVSVLDNLPAHFDADLAPLDVVDALAVWLGLEPEESWSEELRRELLRRAGELTRRRGTRAGVELALKIAFPTLPLRVDDGGSVTWDVRADQPPADRAPGFVVYCDQPITEPEQAAVARMIERVKPVHVPYRLRVKAARKPAAGAD
jgi:phage tail-like protein